MKLDIDKNLVKEYSQNYEKHPIAILPFKTINEKWKNLHDLLFILHFL